MQNRRTKIELFSHFWVLALLNNAPRLNHPTPTYLKYRKDKPTRDGWYFPEDFKKNHHVSATKTGKPRQILMALGVGEEKLASYYDDKNRVNRYIKVIRLARNERTCLKLWLSSIRCNRIFEFMSCDYFVNSPYENLVVEYLESGWGIKNNLLGRNDRFSYEFYVPVVLAKPQLFELFWMDRKLFNKVMKVVLGVFTSKLEAFDFLMAHGTLGWMVEIEEKYDKNVSGQVSHMEKDKLLKDWSIQFNKYYSSLKGLHYMQNFNDIKTKLEEKRRKAKK